MKVFTKNKREMWVSNNRVLVGGSKKVTGRNPNFDTDETRLLISLWGDPKVQKTLITTHKKHAVIARLADKMRDYGYQRSAEEINTRIKNLKCFYNRIKKDMETGSNNEPTWKHFAAMDEIMTRPIFSVRPNEIPKPSLRYKLEEAKREREERGETLDEIEEAELMRTLQANQINNTDDTTNFEKFNDNKDDPPTNNFVNDSEMEDNDNEDNDNGHDDDINTYDDDMDYEPVPGRNSNNSNSRKNNNDEKTSSMSLRTRSRRNENANRNNDENQNDLHNINQNSIDIEESSIIKDEPIDVDDDSNEQKQSEEDKESDSFPLAEYLKPGASSSQPLNKNKIITTVAASLNSSTSSTTMSSSPLKLGQPTSIISMPTTNSGSNVTSNTQAKISLVPTNFLLKPQSQNLQEVSQQKQTQQQQGSQSLKSNTLQGLQLNRQIPIRPKPSQPRIIYTHQATGNQPANGIVNTSNGPMKVLLVNALQKNAQNVQNIVTPTGAILQNKSVDIQNNALYQSSSGTLQSNLSNMNKIPQSPSVNLNGMVSSTSGEKLNLLGTPSSNGKTAIGYRALLGQLIRTQEESNQINRQRLQLERERFEYEKSAGERFLKFLPDVIPNLLNIIQQQQQSHHRFIPEQTMTQPIFVTAPIVSAVESTNNTFSEVPANRNSEKKDDAPLVLLTPKQEKQDD
ncbi:putative uncharacterized protein DDB_G0285119 [Condylostylus longicornis]|uniref:putative uncharacterized protein DDB_G0285119 n=1 Tax=Condylostylus longicornis TaxID=2530218 RepID=UPI00244E5330|nr:putative uncharacterized protein DDB_G0285119 [Condylostylus longicornis]XP_055373014.1 putative uncharacterized protein DDB_G0285119 [Condylostylus longicornis]